MWNGDPANDPLRKQVLEDVGLPSDPPIEIYDPATGMAMPGQGKIPVAADPDDPRKTDPNNLAGQPPKSAVSAKTVAQDGGTKTAKEPATAGANGNGNK